MKRKLLLWLLALIAAGAVSWYWQRDWKLSQPLVQLPVINQTQFPIFEEKKEEQSSPDNNEVLKAMAAEIISRPIMVSEPLSEVDRKRAEGKLKEMVGLIQADNDNIYAWYDLGAYRRVIGDYEGAAEAWTFAALIRPKDYISYHNLGDLYGFYIKDYPKSEENYFKSIENNPENIRAYLDLATIYEYAYKEKSGQAEKILLQGLAVNPENTSLKSVLDEYRNRYADKSE